MEVNGWTKVGNPLPEAPASTSLRDEPASTAKLRLAGKTPFPAPLSLV